MLPQEWNIQPRALACAVTAQPFRKGERVHSALYWRDGQYTRVDLNAEAWQARNENIGPVSAWQTDFVPPPPPLPETLAKNDAESLLRHLISQNDPATRNARYILALMLERKKVLRQVERQRQAGTVVLIYEHPASGDVWLIEDPGLKLSELNPVQDEVAALLARSENAPAPMDIYSSEPAPMLSELTAPPEQEAAAGNRE